VKVRAHNNAGEERGQPAAAEEPAKKGSAVKKDEPDPNEDRNENAAARDVDGSKLVKPQGEAIPSVGHDDIAQQQVESRTRHEESDKKMTDSAGCAPGAK